MASFIESETIDQTCYKTFMSIMYAALYALSAQGRVGGLKSLQVKHADELIHEGFVLTTEFKTRSKYGYQPVTTSPMSNKMIQFYVEVNL
jgi:hypothetical protein